MIASVDPIGLNRGSKVDIMLKLINAIIIFYFTLKKVLERHLQGMSKNDGRPVSEINGQGRLYYFQIFVSYYSIFKLTHIWLKSFETNF